MSKNNKILCYAPLVQKIQDIDNSIKEMKLKLEYIKDTFCEKGDKKMDDDLTEEVCPDVIESEIALMEIIKEVALDSILEKEPEGEA